MKNKQTIFLFFVIIFSGVFTLQSQEIWTKLEKTQFFTQQKKVFEKKNFPSEYEIINLNFDVLNHQMQRKSIQNNIIKLPNTEGGFSRFSIKETSNFEAKLQAKFPSIKSYSAQGLDDKTAIAKISVGTDGFHAVIFYGDKETLYIDPYTKDKTAYIVYKRGSLPKQDQDFKCLVENTTEKQFSLQNFARNVNDGVLRTYRMALVCSGEYAQFHLGASQQNIPVTATEQVKKAAVLSAMNTSMTRVNAVFEKDIAVKMVLVADNDKLIFLDALTDGISDDDPNELIDEVQVICDTTIGNSNYDIGHVFSTSGGQLSGLAGLGVVCITGQKAKGVTGLGAPVGDPYDIDLVAHELGHQFGATHTQHNDCNRTQTTAIEPGSGSTIMGYAGICAPNVQFGNPAGNSDDYFHAVSIAQMWAVIQTSGSCATTTNTNNNAPTANAGADFSIPKSTPFKLTGTATDADGLASLTYNWEQLDREILDNAQDRPDPISSLNIEGPLFRSLPSKIIPVRYFPAIATIASGSTFSAWEHLPDVARELNFSFFVRDNNAGGGSSARDDVEITVIDTDPFIVTAPNTAVSWNTGSTQTITWNKSTTDVAPINATLVNIKLSIDGGLTFPIVLKNNTPNDGSETVLIPDNPTNTARIMIEAVDHIFYNMNTTNFTINSTAPTFVVKNEVGIQEVCNSGDETAIYTLDFDFVNGFSETVTLSASGFPTGASVVFSPTTINTDGTVLMTISNLNAVAAQNYTINILGTSTSINQNIEVGFKVLTATFNDVTLTSPANNATVLSLVEELQWTLDENATSYDVEIATDIGFANIISSGNVNTNSYVTTNLAGTTKYYWRVKPKNDCGEGVFSTPFSFTTNQPEYCASTFTDENGGSEYISNVTFVGINNTSGNNVVDGYQDFTAINTNVLKGQTQQISVTFDTAGYQDHCYVFIDWNQDFIFDTATERYDLGTGLDNVSTRTFDITIPEDAKYGQTRMRVIIEYDDPSTGFGEGPCDADHLTEWGETEDYSITVVEPIIQPNNFTILSISETCPGENDGMIQVDVLQNEFTYQFELTGEGTTITENSTSTNYNVFNLNPGTYEVCFFVIELNETYCFEVVVPAAETIALKVSPTKQANKFAFKIAQGTPPFEIFVNDKIIGTTSEKEFDFELEESGVLKVKTAKECEGVFEKNIGDILSANTSTINLMLISNPVKDVIEIQIPTNINSQNIQATIFDMTGKLVYKNKADLILDKLTIPFSNFSKGIYILKLSINNTKPIKILKQ